VLTLILGLLAARGAGAPDELAQGFQNPPDAAKPHTWWHWVNDHISREGITADLEAMKRVGVGGAQIFNVDVGVPAGPVKFMSAPWREMVLHAVREADRLGLELCIHNCGGWSSSGGPWVKPEHAMQKVVTCEVQVQGPKSFSEVLPQPETRHGFYRDIAVVAFRTPQGHLRIDNLRAKAAYDRADNLSPAGSPTAPPDSVVLRVGLVDLTSRLQGDGRLTWNVPAGEWTILRVGYTPTGSQNAPATPEARGLEVDKLSREAMDAFWSGMMATVLRDIGPLGAKSLNNALIDSYEVGSQNWSPRFREEFRKRRGYDLLPYLPVFAGYVVDSPEVSERFLWDLRRTIADLFAENYFGYFGELCHRHGLQFSTEPYGNGAFEDLACGGRADIPMGEFWVGGGVSGSCKLAASAAHTYGRKLVGAESFTATPEQGRWQNDPYSLKALGDLIYCLGVNRFIFHRYAHQPWLRVRPGMTMGPWGFHFERTNTWWEQGAAWLKYLARCQYLLQQGRFVADVVYFVGENAPVSMPLHEDLKERGYDYDGCNAEALGRLRVENGRLVLPDGLSYCALVLPDSEYMTPSSLRKIRDLVQAGALVLGPKPRKSPSLANYPKSDAEVQRLAEEVWGDCNGQTVQEHRFGLGRVVWGQPLERVLWQLGVKPDLAYRPPSARLKFIHRRVGNADLYFVSNQRPRVEEVEVTFRVKGKVPELWHPDTGKIEPAPLYREVNDRIAVPLRFEPAGSVFVVFRERAGKGDHLIAAKHIPAVPAKPSEAPQLEIRRAIYEAIDGAGSADVTERVAGMVREGTLSLNANNTTLGGDPVPMHLKRLRVEYVLNGKPQTIVVTENEDLEISAAGGGREWPAFELTVAGNGQRELRAFEPGRYELRNNRSTTWQVEVASLPPTLEVGGPWRLQFPPHQGAPAEVTLDSLISWTEHPDPGVRYFSGSATYFKEFDLPAEMVQPGRALYLDLGQVKNLCEVRVNGHDCGVLWKPPFRVELTGIARVGRNRLAVRVTNLWVNRLIGDEQFPDDCEWNGPALKQFPEWFLQNQPRPSRQRLTFTTWKHFSKDSPLRESGLLGPVTVRAAATVSLR